MPRDAFPRASCRGGAQALVLPLLLQHVVVLVKYHSKLLYVLAEAVLEIAWEWEIFAQQRNLTADRGFHRCRARSFSRSFRTRARAKHA